MNLQQAVAFGQTAAVIGSVEPLSPAEALLATYHHHWVGDDLEDGATGAWVDRNSAAEIWLGGTAGDDLGDEPTVAAGVVSSDGINNVAVVRMLPALDAEDSLTIGMLMSTEAADPAGRLFCTANDTAGGDPGLESRWRGSRNLDVILSDGTNTAGGSDLTVPSTGFFWLSITITPSTISLAVNGGTPVENSRATVTGDATSTEYPGLFNRPTGANESQVALKRVVIHGAEIPLADWATIAGSVS